MTNILVNNRPQSLPRSGRDKRLDKARILLIWLVVFGHFIKPFLDMHPIFGALYIYIYSFHMPAFVMLAGMTSKAGIAPKVLRSLGTKILAPLLIFSVIYELFYFTLKGEISIYLREGSPHWILWFLLSLLIWRLSLPYLLRLRYPIILSFALACLVGFIDNFDKTLSLSRTVYYLPFFLIGHGLYSGRYTVNFDAIMNRVSLPTALAWMIILAGTLYLASPIIIHQMFYGSLPYSDFSTDLVRMMLMRMALLFLSMISALALIRLTASAPQLPAIYPHNTLWVYLWHGLLIILIAHLLDSMTLPDRINSAQALVLVIVSAGISWGLCMILSHSLIAQWSNTLTVLPNRLINRFNPQ